MGKKPASCHLNFSVSRHKMRAIYATGCGEATLFIGELPCEAWQRPTAFPIFFAANMVKSRFFRKKPLKITL
jgi:hypothetical protein